MSEVKIHTKRGRNVVGFQSGARNGAFALWVENLERGSFTTTNLTRSEARHLATEILRLTEEEGA